MAGAPQQIIERKLKPDGTLLEYRCRGLHVEPAFAIVRFEMRRGGQLPDLPVTIPPGSVSDGYFWSRRPYSIYRMRAGDGTIIAHRIDAVAGVLIDDQAVSYRDLVLDWWVLPGGRLIEEDRDELDELVARGSLSDADFRRAEQAARLVTSRYRHILDELAQLERRFGALAIPVAGDPTESI